jgi:hypothetical protein
MRVAKGSEMRKRVNSPLAVSLLFLAAIMICPYIVNLALAGELYELKGDRLGMSLEEFKAKYHRVVKGTDHPAPACSKEEDGFVTCTTIFMFEQIKDESVAPTIAGVPTDSLLYEFMDGTLFRISASFSKSNYTTVRDGFIAKYGKPSNVKMLSVQNKMGGQFPSTETRWLNGLSSIILVERSYRLDNSSMLMEHIALSKAASFRSSKSSADDL